MTVLEATKNGPVMLLMGENQTYSPDRIVWKIKKTTDLSGNLTQFAVCYPYTWIDDKFRDASGFRQKMYVDWNRKCTIVE